MTQFIYRQGPQKTGQKHNHGVCRENDQASFDRAFELKKALEVTAINGGHPRISDVYSLVNKDRAGKGVSAVQITRIPNMSEKTITVTCPSTGGYDIVKTNGGNVEDRRKASKVTTLQEAVRAVRELCGDFNSPVILASPESPYSSPWKSSDKKRLLWAGKDMQSQGLQRDILAVCDYLKFNVTSRENSDYANAPFSFDLIVTTGRGQTTLTITPDPKGFRLFSRVGNSSVPLSSTLGALDIYERALEEIKDIYRRDQTTASNSRLAKMFHANPAPS